MLLDKEGSDKRSLAACPSLLGIQVIPAAALVAIILALSCSYNSRNSMPGAAQFAVTAPSALTITQLYIPHKQSAKVTLTLGTELRRSTLRCLPFGNTG